MNRDELLQELATRVHSGELTESDVLQAIGAKQSDTGNGKSNLASRLSAVLYYVGGGIVFLGMVFLIAQEWRHFGTAMKIFVTLGSGIAAFVIGVLFSNQERLGAAGPAFFLLSALLLPVGLVVAYDEAGAHLSLLVTAIQIMGILFAAYLGAYFVIRKTVLLTFALIFGSCFFFTLTDYIVRGAPTVDDWAFMNYRILFAGLAYMFLGYSFVGTDREPLTSWLYAFGAFGLLGAGFALGDWKPHQSLFWESIYPGLVFGVIFISTHVKSRILLIFGSLALGAYLTKITAEYFSDSIGWALSLVLIGFLLMAVAYLAIRVNRRYVTSG